MRDGWLFVTLPLGILKVCSFDFQNNEPVSKPSDAKSDRNQIEFGQILISLVSAIYSLTFDDTNVVFTY